MKQKDRQREIVKLLVARRKDSMSNLAEDLGVTLRTIVGDVAVLIKQYPIITTRGNSGGVRVDDSYHPYRDTLSNEQTRTIIGLMSRANENEKRILEQLIVEYSSGDINLENDE